MARYACTLGVTIETGLPVENLKELPRARVVLLDLTPRQVLDVAGEELTGRYQAQLRRFRYGLGVFKLDWALSGPIPWRQASCAEAATLHLGGTMREIGGSLSDVAQGRRPERPFTIFSQPSLFDSSRAPAGFHTDWGYCHVPNGADWDMTQAIESQVERFAPGFRDLIVARSTLSPSKLQRLDANLVGGDVNGGSAALGQLFFRPVRALQPYDTPSSGLFICSASTPPGGGVHGMCGYHAARRALRYLRVHPTDLPDQEGPLQ